MPSLYTLFNDFKVEKTGARGDIPHGSHAWQPGRTTEAMWWVRQIRRATHYSSRNALLHQQAMMPGGRVWHFLDGSKPQDGF